MRIATKLGLLITLISACGGSSESPASGPAAAPAPPPPPASELHTEHLPPSLAWVSFGETTPAQIAAHFTGDNLMVSDHMAVRGLMPVRARGPNSGRQAGVIVVVQKTDVNGPIGQFGDNWGSVTFSFTPLADGQPPVLYGLEIAQRENTGSLCQPALALAAGAGLEGCDPNDVIPPSAPGADGAFHACINHTGGRVLSVRCQVLSNTKILAYELAVGQVTAAPAPAPAP